MTDAGMTDAGMTVIGMTCAAAKTVLGPDVAVLASAPVTDWPERIALTLLVAAAIASVLALMRWGWVARGRRQGDIVPLPDVPELPATPLDADQLAVSDVPARYLGAARSGDWLDRVVVHGLGVPSAARVTISGQGVWVTRSGAPDIFVAADELAGVRHDRAMAGRVLEQDGILVVTWRHRDRLIDLGLRVRDAVAAEAVRAAIAAQLTASPQLTNSLTKAPGETA